MPLLIDSGRFARRCRTALVVCGLSAVLACGCLSSGLPHGDSKAENADPNLSVQSGMVSVPAGVFLDVYYATPFASVPALKIAEDGGRCMAVIQTANHFRILNSTGKDVVAHWKAQGTRGAAAATRPTPQAAPVQLAQPQRVAPQDSPAAGLPPEPEPVTAPQPRVVPAGP
jgi:hypothetical protein